MKFSKNNILEGKNRSKYLLKEYKYMNELKKEEYKELDRQKYYLLSYS